MTLPDVKLPTDDKLETTRDLRTYIRGRVTETTTGRQSPDHFTLFVEQSCVKNTDEWKVIERLALEIQRLGFRVIRGAVPMQALLAGNGPNIVEDWGYCCEHVKIQHKDSTDMQARVDPSVQFSRRHGEWLALVASLYLRRNWQGDRIKYLLERLPTIEVSNNRIELIHRIDAGIIPDEVRDAVVVLQS